MARPGDRWAPEGAFREPGGLWGEILGALGSSFGGSGDILGDLGVDFFTLFDTMRHRLQQNSKLKAGRESRIHAKPNTQGVTTALEQGFGQPQRASKLA